MTPADEHGQPDDPAEIVRLLDQRYQLREDPDRRDELDRTHERLRELLRRIGGRQPIDETPDRT